MKKFFIGFFVFCLLGVVGLVWGGYAALNSASLYEKIMPILINNVIENSPLTNLSISDVSLGMDGKYSFSTVEMNFEGESLSPDLSFESLAISSIFNAFGMRPERDFGVKVSQVVYSDGTLDIAGLDAEAVFSVDKAGASKMEGQLLVDRAMHSDVRATDISAKFESITDALRIYNMEARAYEGSIVGSMQVPTKENGDLFINVNIAGVDLSRMADDKPVISSYVSGVVNGAVNVEGTMNGIGALTGNIAFLPNAQLKARLLQPLIQYLPSNTIQRQELESLVQTDDMVTIDVGSVALKNVGNDTVSAAIVVQSKKFNLDINLTVDFVVEGGLDSVFQVGTMAFTPKK